MSRLAVNKTYKLYVNGAFPRSESGRVVSVSDPKGNVIARVAHASRKDLRDAVKAAIGAQASWAARTGYNRGQILYRIAEVLEDRAETFVGALKTLGHSQRSATNETQAAIDRLVWYAGWCDKFSQFSGNVNPVSGPFFNISAPEPTGVVGLLAPGVHPLLGMVSRLAPALVPGNTTVAVTPTDHATVAIDFAEVVHASDVPAGVINILTGDHEELAPWLARHAGVNAIDLSGADRELRRVAGELASATVMRVIPGPPAEDKVDWLAAAHQSPYIIEKFTETKTVWHPKGQ